MLRHTPVTVQSRYRLYTTQRHRDEIDTLDTPYGRTTPVSVGIVAVERDCPWDGTFARSATFETTLGYYGEIRLPATVRTTCAIAVGDTVRLTVSRRRDASSPLSQ